VATEALRRRLDIDTVRPIQAKVVKDNLASMRVQEMCGCVATGSDEGFAHDRGEVVEEFVMALTE
jgi:RimJ/RimL family protein N-acetyltransferase